MPRTVTLQGEEFVEQDLICPECGEAMELKPSKHGLFYGCSTWRDTKCPGGHSAHADGRPMGIPADRKTKGARRAAHHVFDHLWKEGHMTRGAAYRWMQRAMKLKPDDAHIGRFTRAQCKALVLAFRREHPKLWKKIRGPKA